MMSNCYFRLHEKICGQSFTRSFNLKRHCQNIHLFQKKKTTLTTTFIISDSKSRQRSNLLNRNANTKTTRYGKEQGTNFSHLLKCLISPFFLSQFFWLFLLFLSLFFPFRFCLIARSLDVRKISDVVDCSARFFHCSAVKRSFFVKRPQRATGSNTQSMNLTMFSIKTPDFLWI